MGHGLDVVESIDHALREQKPGHQFQIVARGSHGDGDGSAIDADLEGFLGGHEVRSWMGPIFGDPFDAHGSGRLVHWPSVLNTALVPDTTAREAP